MIPIDETKPIPKELDGVKYSFLPVCGEKELLFYAALKASGSKEMSAFLKEAEAQVEAENDGKSWEAGEKEKAVRARASKLAEDSEGVNFYEDKDAVLAADRLIDGVLVGWEAPGLSLPAFPAHNHPSRCFKVADKLRLFNLICELNSVGEIERKN